MDSSEFSHISLPSHDRLLSESMVFPSGSHSEPDNSDLSLSDLSLGHDRPKDKRPFSLLARPPQEESAIADDEEQGEGGLDATMTQEDLENARRQAARTREEKLQHDLFILKKLNSAFEVYKGALREAKSATDRVSMQLSHTNALLDKYTSILHNSERVTKLILDERWEGAETDEALLEAEDQAELERRQKEEEAIRREQERKEREERERQEREEREERERLAREKAEKVKEKTTRGLGSSGVRGVRGTRASMRAASSVRGGTTRGRGASPSGIPAPSSTSGIRRPGSSISARGRGVSRRGT